MGCRNNHRGTASTFQCIAHATDFEGMLSSCKDKVYSDVAELEEVPGNTRKSQEERPGSQRKSQKERSGSLVLGVFGAFAELLSERRPLKCHSRPLRDL